MMQDEELIRLYVTRSERAIALTSDKYGGYCHTIAYQILKDLEDSEECVNDAYWKAWNVIPPTMPIGESKVKMMLSRTRKELRDYLEKEGVEL